MARLHIGTFFLNWIKTLPGSKRCLYNKAIMSSPIILGKLLHETFRVTSQLLRFLHHQRGLSGTRTNPPATTTTRLNLLFHSCCINDSITLRRGQVPQEPEPKQCLTDLQTRHWTVICQKGVKSIYKSSISEVNNYNKNIKKSFENNQRSIWRLHLGWDILNDHM